jgi:uridine kinase
MFIIGIAGGTGSGKTTVVRKLIERLPKGEVVVIPQDSYYNDSSHVPFEERQNINFDHPDAFEWPLLAKHIEMLKNGESIEQPIYDYITSSRQQETVHVDPREIIIVEGIMALHDPILRKQMDLKIILDEA